MGRAQLCRFLHGSTLYRWVLTEEDVMHLVQLHRPLLVLHTQICVAWKNNTKTVRRRPSWFVAGRAVAHMRVSSTAVAVTNARNIFPPAGRDARESGKRGAHCEQIKHFRSTFRYTVRSTFRSTVRSTFRSTFRSNILNTTETIFYFFFLHSGAAPT